MKKFKIITGTPVECEDGLNRIKDKIEIESVETKFDKYGVERMAIVVSISVAAFPTELKGR